MVKTDLEAVGIKYETAEGIADFHAAGRHSHVSGLVNSGVSLAHARQLARHGDVRMTMRYTHVGLEDQAEALKSLPAPSAGGSVGKNGKSNVRGAKKSAARAQHMRSTSEPRGSHSGSPAGTEPSTEPNGEAIKNPRDGRGYDAEGHSVSSDGKTTRQWRRRESNPRLGFASLLLLSTYTQTGLHKFAKDDIAHAA